MPKHICFLKYYLASVSASVPSLGTVHFPGPVQEVGLSTLQLLTLSLSQSPYVVNRMFHPLLIYVTLYD